MPSPTDLSVPELFGLIFGVWFAGYCAGLVRAYVRRLLNVA